jgi:hypothetical protein
VSDRTKPAGAVIIVDIIGGHRSVKKVAFHSFQTSQIMLEIVASSYENDNQAGLITRVNYLLVFAPSI